MLLSGVVVRVKNHSLIDDPTARVPGFDLPRLWAQLNRFRTDQGSANLTASGRQSDDPLCCGGKVQTVAHIVNFCPLSKLDEAIGHTACHCSQCCRCMAWQSMQKLEEELDKLLTDC